MEAGVLKCPMCGASAGSDLTRCSHCGARLATVACPNCFGMLFRGAKFCPHCGSRAKRLDAPLSPGHKCPRCAVDMCGVTIGETPLLECAKCSGLWVSAAALERICSDPKHQESVLGHSHPVGETGATLEARIRYLPCPICKKLMNRVNFARSSSVVVDVCKPHGTWFDRHELQRIIQFIRQGGLDIARRNELDELEERRRKVENAERMQRTRYEPGGQEPHLLDGVAAVAASIILGAWD